MLGRVRLGARTLSVAMLSVASAGASPARSQSNSGSTRGPRPRDPDCFWQGRSARRHGRTTGAGSEQVAQPGAKTIRDVMERTDGFDLDLVAARSD